MPVLKIKNGRNEGTKMVGAFLSLPLYQRLYLRSLGREVPISTYIEQAVINWDESLDESLTDIVQLVIKRAEVALKKIRGKNKRKAFVEGLIDQLRKKGIDDVIINEITTVLYL